ncbi:uncharacterized protein LOC107818894 [Nicotiana tabacum]|uniref:Uncharacterized protein LOC107818894 n=1 Tax=Nicotiana tabacum TaxID=4097 RepID=A0AC58TIZ4_TOBAC
MAGVAFLQPRCIDSVSGSVSGFWFEVVKLQSSCFVYGLVQFQTAEIMVKSQGRGDKQKGKGESSRGRGQRMIRLTPQARQNIKNTRRLINAADSAIDQSGSEYEPSWEASDSDSVPEYVPDWLERNKLRDTPPGSPTAQTSVHISSKWFEGLAAGSGNEYSTSLTTSLSWEGPVEGEGEKLGGGETQVGGVERTRNPEAWHDRFVSEVAYHKFREWWPERKLIPERKFITKDLMPHNPNVLRQFM